MLRWEAAPQMAALQHTYAGTVLANSTLEGHRVHTENKVPRKDYSSRLRRDTRARMQGTSVKHRKVEKLGKSTEKDGYSKQE